MGVPNENAIDLILTDSNAFSLAINDETKISL